MIDYKDTIYADGSKQFVSNISPSLDDIVKVRIRVVKNSPVKKVKLRIIRNGEHEFLDADLIDIDNQFDYFEADVLMSQERIQYCFVLLTDNKLYYFNQMGLSILAPDRKHDFVLLANYKQPSWVKDAIFYQIFPERFCNGDPNISVKDKEYKLNGYDTMAIKDWNKDVGTYDECHCVDFYGGDLIGIIQKIPYLKKLGVNALYLNPIFIAPSVHKYDCIDYFNVDPHFGGNDALINLSKKLHENGMKLILDISINHTGTAHKWFNKDFENYDRSIGAYNNPNSKERNYYVIYDDGTYECWDNDKSLPKLNYLSNDLREMIFKSEDSVLKHWLKKPYSIDGWRFDVADVLANFNKNQLGNQIWPKIRKSIKEVNSNAYILAEHWDDCSEFLQGNMWDGVMNYYGFGRIIREFYGLSDPILERNDELAGLSKGISACEFKKRYIDFMSTIPYVIQQVQYNLFDSHDIGRFTSYQEANIDKFEGATIAMFTLIGVPSIYYGDEASIKGRTGYFEGARYPMPWNKDFESDDIFKLHQKLIKLRKEHKVFSEGSIKFLYAEGNIMAYTRFDRNEAFIIFLSTSSIEEDININTCVSGHTFEEGIKQKEDVLGNKIDGNCVKYDLHVKLKPYASYIVKSDKNV